MARPWTEMQRIFEAADATATVVIPDMSAGPSKVWEIVYNGFSGTIDIQGKVDGGAWANVPYVLANNATAPSRAVAQLSLTTESSTKTYLTWEPMPQMRIVMTRTAGDVSVTVWASETPITGY